MTPGLSECLTGWTGTIVVDTVTVTPRHRDSVASVMSRLVQRCETMVGGVWTVTASAAGVITIAWDGGTFALTSSGTAATRTALASGTGASSYTGTGAHTGGVYPSRGLATTPGTPVTTRGRIVGDGSVAVAGTPSPGVARVTVYDTHAAMWAWESTLAGVYDVWGTGARGPLVRMRVTELRRVRQGRLASDGLALELAGQEVSR